VKQNRLWFLYAMITVLAWGVWGAFIDTPAQHGFPETLGYVVWAFVMIPPALVALWIVGWKVEYDAKSIFWGCVAGFLGAGGQLILFKTLRMAPAYLVFPYVALSPVVTIVMALLLSKERATMKGWIGIALAVVAGVLLSYVPPAGEGEASRGLLWVLLASLVLLAWGIQGFAISHANKSMKAESIFFYMMLTSVLLIPIAIAMTDFSKEINWRSDGPGLAAGIQILNSIGALLLVYAFRYGKAIIVSPLTNAGAPVVTVVLSLVMTALAHKLEWTTATTVNMVGVVAAVVATMLMAIEGEKG
jgi:drug/metabolite transporter (DMT)-like permease